MKAYMKRTEMQPLVGAAVLALTLLLSAGQGPAAQQQRNDDKVATQPPSASSTISSPCGEAMVFSREAGRMVKRHRVDLVVVKVEIMRRGDGNAAVKPTIRNRCPDATTADVEVSMNEVSTSFGKVGGNATVTLGHWIGLAEADSYRVEVDSRHRNTEINEGNNVCIARIPRGVERTTDNCR